MCRFSYNLEKLHNKNFKNPRLSISKENYVLISSMSSFHRRGEGNNLISVNYITLTEYFLARHIIISFRFHNTTICCCYFHFTDEATEAQKLPQGHVACKPQGCNTDCGVCLPSSHTRLYAVEGGIVIWSFLTILWVMFHYYQLHRWGNWGPECQVIG